jgi:cellulose synthase (UDP-forming)
MNDFHNWTPLFFVAGFLLVVLQLQRPISKYQRALAAFMCIAVSVRYLYWRIFFTFPFHQNLLQRSWAFAFLLMEVGSVLSCILVFFFMSRQINRTAEADAAWNSPLQRAPVDVFIATYNESKDILERTIIGAKSIQHSDLRVWLLDDGARPWAQQLAEELGALYISRVNGKHAKAGNVNNGLKYALSHGRKPEFILLLDADFIPARKILRRVMGLFEPHDIGIVQTPQHFFNADPLQANLVCTAVWPDEQRFFFNAVMPSKDAWDTAFCCGTSAVFRVAALEACSGMATETVTEDLLTSFRMREFGYRTIYLNERLSMGLAAENLGEFLTQRSRWCLGTIQQVFTRWSFFRINRVNLINRLSFFDSVLYWLTSAPFKFMLISAPVLYWLTGTSIIRASMPEILYWLAPTLAANLIFMHFAAGNRVLPIITDISQLITIFVVKRTIITAIVHPFGQAFKVTAKGMSSSGVVVRWDLLGRLAAMGLLTIAGVLLNIGKFAPSHGAEGYSMNLVWSIVNIALLGLGCVVCVELPQRRHDHRFVTGEKALVCLDDGCEISCKFENISLGGACLFREQGWSELSTSGTLLLEHDGLEVPFTVAGRRGQKIGLMFETDTTLHRALIRKIFTGDYHQEIDKISALDVFRRLAVSLVK